MAWCIALVQAEGEGEGGRERRWDRGEGEGREGMGTRHDEGSTYQGWTDGRERVMIVRSM